MNTRTTVYTVFLIIFCLSIGASLWGQQTSASSFLPVADTYVVDLTIFRWICTQASVNADTPRLTRRMTQAAAKPVSKTSEWALVTFIPSGNPTKLVAPDPEDKRVARLVDMKAEITTALRNRQSYPVESAAGLNRAQASAGEMGFEVSQAMLLKLLGDLCLYYMSRHSDALTYYSRASLVFGKTEEAYAANAILYDDLAYLKSEQGIYSEAKEHYVQAALHWQALANENPNNLNFLLNAGRKYNQAGDADRAAGNFDSAVELKNKGLDSLRKYAHATKSYPTLIQSLIDTAELHVDRGDSKRADALLEEARKLVERCNDYLLIARLYKTSSKVFEAAGNKQQALTYSRKQKQTLSKAALEGEAAIFKLSGKIPMTQAAQLRLINSSMVGAQAYVQLQNNKRAVVLWDFISNYNQKENKIENRITALRALASIHNSQGESDAAKSSLEKAVASAENSGKTSLALDIMQEYVDFLESSNNTADTMKAYSSLIATAESIGNIRIGTSARVGRGKLLAAGEKYDEAIKDLQNGCQRWLSVIGDVWMYAGTSLILADVYTKTARNADATALLESVIKEASASYMSGAANYETGQMMSEICGKLLRLYVGANEIDKANSLIGKYESSSWMPMLMRNLSDDPDPRISALALNASGSTGTGNIDEDDVKHNILADNAAAFTTVCWSLAETRKADYAAMAINPLTVMSSRHLMAPNEVFVQYMMTDSSLYVFVLGQKQTVCVEVREVSRKISDAYRSLKKSIQKCEASLASGVPVAPVVTRDETSYLEIREPLNRLYDMLIDPVKDSLPEESVILFALPPQILGMPMHSLVSIDKQGSVSYLCEKYIVTFASSSSLRSLGNTAKPSISSNTSNLVVFADPNGDLPGARKEAESISNIYKNSRIYVGSQASVDVFYKEIAAADILHIAAHHSIDTGSTKQLLKLASGSSGDGSIVLADLLARQPIRPKLVFLSTCDALYSSDSMVDSLNKTGEAFLLAGAGSVLGGLWKISDEAEALMAMEFYKGIVEGQSIYQSIRRAQLSMIKSTDGRFAHPYYWAALALYGSPE